MSSLKEEDLKKILPENGPPKEEVYKYIEKYKIDYLKKNENYILDIGSGDGENTVFLSEKFKESKIIACDKFKDGNINLCEQIKLKKLNNICIFPGNVHELLDNNT